MPAPCPMLYVACISLQLFPKANRIPLVGPIGAALLLPPPSSVRLVLILLLRAGRQPMQLSSWQPARNVLAICSLALLPLFQSYWGILFGSSNVSVYEDSLS